MFEERTRCRWEVWQNDTHMLLSAVDMKISDYFNKATVWARPIFAKTISEAYPKQGLGTRLFKERTIGARRAKGRGYSGRK